jgi:hypothetical protein
MASYKQSSKINKIRTFALSLVFIGIFIAYIGIFFRTNFLFMSILVTLGTLATVASAGVYAWVGMLSTKAVMVECPNCGKTTKVLGRADACMSCQQPLTMDRELEGKELDSKYNRKAHVKKS